MKTYTTAQLQEAQDWRPQIERFVVDGAVYVVETPQDYAELPAVVQAMIDLRNQI